jgi:hypothetical protein
MSQRDANPEEGKEVDYYNPKVRAAMLADLEKYNPDPLSHQKQMTSIRNKRNADNDAAAEAADEAASAANDAAYKAAQKRAREEAINRNATTLKWNAEIADRNTKANQEYQDAQRADEADQRRADDAIRYDKIAMKKIIKTGNQQEFDIAKRVIPYYVEHALDIQANQPRLENMYNYLNENTSAFNLTAEYFKSVLAGIEKKYLLEILFNHPEYYPSTVLSTDEVKRIAGEIIELEANRMDMLGGKKTKRRKTKRRSSRRKRRTSRRNRRSSRRRRR